jgi:hypothetical protein
VSPVLGALDTGGDLCLDLFLFFSFHLLLTNGTWETCGWVWLDLPNHTHVSPVILIFCFVSALVVSLPSIPIGVLVTGNSSSYQSMPSSFVSS